MLKKSVSLTSNLGKNITLKLPDFQNVTHTEFPEGLVNIMSREQDFR